MGSSAASAPRDLILGSESQFQTDVPQGRAAGRFADSNWENCVSRRSITGLMAQYNETIQVVLWRSKMEETISQYTAEAGYYAADNMGFTQAPDTSVV
jgi:hypothetical protein